MHPYNRKARYAYALWISAAQVEGITIDEEGLAYLGETSERTSLRHAVQLLTPAATLAGTNGRDDVNKTDLEEVCAQLVGFKPWCRGANPSEARRKQKCDTQFTCGLSNMHQVQMEHSCIAGGHAFP